MAALDELEEIELQPMGGDHEVHHDDDSPVLGRLARCMLNQALLVVTL